MLLCVAMCWMTAGAGSLPADTETWSEAMGLVDQLGWAATDDEVARYRRRITKPGSVYAQSLREEARRAARPLSHATLYAVEAEVAPPMVHLREAVVYTNQSAQPLESLVFRVFPGAVGQRLSVGAVHVQGHGAAFTLSDSVLMVRLSQPLPPGRSVRLLLELWERVPPFDPAEPLVGDRLSSTEVGAFGMSGGAMNLAWWLPVLTPLSDEGVFDLGRPPSNGEPSGLDTAMFHVVLDVPEALVVASTGVELQRRTTEGRTTLALVASAVRDFSVSLAPDLDVLQTTVDGVLVRVFHPADEALMGRHMLQHAEASLRHHTSTYGPLAAAEIDLVEVPLRVALGLELSELLWVDMRHGGAYSRTPVQEWTIAHEVAHLWWSGEVGSDAARAPWLDEALAEASAASYWEARHGRASLQERWRAEVLDPYDALEAAGVADLPADLPGEGYTIWQYASVVYGRAALFFDEVEGLVGPAAFRQALTDYHERMRWGQATERDLMDALRRQAQDPQELELLYRRWILEAHGFEDVLH